jgi:hypothetical protein
MYGEHRPSGVTICRSKHVCTTFDQFEEAVFPSPVPTVEYNASQFPEITETALCQPACSDSNEEQQAEKACEAGLKYDSEKLMLDLLPPELIEAWAEVKTFGAKKYAKNTWQNLEDFENRYYSAAFRHIIAYRKGEEYDKESGLRHLAHALTNIGFLLWKQIQEDKP